MNRRSFLKTALASFAVTFPAFSLFGGNKVAELKVKGLQVKLTQMPNMAFQGTVEPRGIDCADRDCPLVGDWWYNPLDDIVRVYDGREWKKIKMPLY